MPALSYKSNFVDYVENGFHPFPADFDRMKRQTIRNFRKHVIKKGDTLYHYYGMRTKHCRKLGESTASSVRNIIINHHSVLVAMQESGYPEWKGVWVEITHQESLDDFAYADGFANWREMKLWWKVTHGMGCFPFVGQLIKW